MIHRSLWLVLVFTVVMLSSATVARAADRQRVLFEDEFAGKLGDGWSWVYEDPPNWRVVAGKFQIRPTGGSSWMKNRDGRNYLVRTPPEVQGGELAVEVFVENRPTQPYEHAGLMWYYDDDHYVTLNKEQIDGKPTVLWVVEKAGIPQPPFGDTPYQNDGIWLRSAGARHPDHRRVPYDGAGTVAHGRQPGVAGPWPRENLPTRRLRSEERPGPLGYLQPFPRCPIGEVIKRAGLDISRLLFGTGPSPRQVFFYYRGTRLYAARKGPYKAHFVTQSAYGPDKPVKHDPPLLYHLGHDPSERFDIATAHPDVLRDIAEEVERHQATVVPARSQLEETVIQQER